VLPGVLLHVVLPPFAIDAAMHCRTREWHFHRRLQIVDDPTILRIRNFGDAQSFFGSITAAKRKPSGIVHLTAAGRIKRRFAQDNRRPRLP
jgi:hypothetical protein